MNVSRKGNLGKCILVLVLVSSVFVLAGDVVVKQGKIEAENIAATETIEGEKFQSTGCDTSSGTKAVAFGYDTEASGNYSTALGAWTSAIQRFSTAMGYRTIASGDSATAMGADTIASGDYSTAMGEYTEASDDYCTAMGYQTTASKYYSTAMGSYSTASGMCSTAIGSDVTAGPAWFTTAIGRYSTNDVAYSFTVGYGSDAQNHAVDLRVRSDLVNVYGDLEVDDKVTMGTLVLPVSSSVPGSPVEGQIYVDTNLNEVRVYAESGWRTLSSW